MNDKIRLGISIILIGVVNILICLSNIFWYHDRFIACIGVCLNGIMIMLIYIESKL